MPSLSGENLRVIYTQFSKDLHCPCIESYHNTRLLSSSAPINPRKAVGRIAGQVEVDHFDLGVAHIARLELQGRVGFEYCLGGSDERYGRLPTPRLHSE